MTWLLIILVVGVNFTFWAVVGLLRLVGEGLRSRSDERHRLPEPMPAGTDLPVAGRSDAAVHPADVAAIIPAHNEEKGIAGTIVSVRRLLSPSQIHVVSDGSTDDTARIARACGVNVLELPEGRGKAKALQAAIDEYALTRRYRALLFLDGDTQLDRLYLANALPALDDPEYVAVAGWATTKWPRLTFRAMQIVAHRERIYVLMQLLLKFGQTARRLNVAYIIPGFASIYRSEAVEQIDITAPGLIIEDFNMTFEVHRRRLGKIAFTHNSFAYTQDPDNLRDYVRQVRRWTLGFWQTFRRHGVWRSAFSLALVLFVIELLTSSLVFLLFPFVLTLLLLPELTDGAILAVPGLAPVYDLVSSYLPLTVVLLGVVLPDLVLTVVTALYERRPEFLKFALGFLPMRVLDAAVTLYTLPLAFKDKTSTGMWTSPKRR